MISAISPSEDKAILTAMNTPRDIPKPILYYNYIVGECRDLIFGVALVDYATAHNLPDGAVPKVIVSCVKEVEARGMDTEGIYRVRFPHEFNIAAVQSTLIYMCRCLADMRMYKR